MEGKLFANLVLLIIFVYAAIGNLMAWGFNKTNWVPFTKPLLMPVLAIYYVLNAENIEWILVAALFFAFLGDVFLIWPKKKVFFIGGLVFFLVMQILYTIFIATRQLNFEIFSIPVVAAAIVFLFSGGLVYFKLYKFLNEMKIPVLVYILILNTIGLLCFVNMAGNFNKYNFIQFIGALFFIVSDALLAFETFKGPMRLGNVWIMATYINAQLLLFAGFMNTY